MILEVQRLLDQYQAWLRDKTSLRQIDEWVEITTPYLDRHNDCIQIYARKQNDGYVLTDDAYTISDLETSGCRIESPRRQQLLKATLNGFGVSLRGKALEVRSTTGEFAIRKHNLLQAILAVNDMFYLAAPVVSSLFLEDVTAWLDLNEVRYTPKVKFTGKSGFDHLFNFVIPKSRSQPERLLQVINHPNRDAAQVAVFAWTDMREVRSIDVRMYAFLNDVEQHAPAGVVEAMSNYGVIPVPWSDRQRVAPELVA